MRLSFRLIDLLSELVSEVFYVEDMTSCFALVFPFFTVSIEDTASKEIHHGTMKFRSFNVVFKIVYIKRI